MPVPMLPPLGARSWPSDLDARAQLDPTDFRRLAEPGEWRTLLGRRDHRAGRAERLERLAAAMRKKYCVDDPKKGRRADGILARLRNPRMEVRSV